LDVSFAVSPSLVQTNRQFQSCTNLGALSTAIAIVTCLSAIPEIAASTILLLVTYQARTANKSIQGLVPLSKLGNVHESTCRRHHLIHLRLLHLPHKGVGWGCSQLDKMSFVKSIRPVKNQTLPIWRKKNHRAVRTSAATTTTETTRQCSRTFCIYQETFFLPNLCLLDFLGFFRLYFNQGCWFGTFCRQRPHIPPDETSQTASSSRMALIRNNRQRQLPPNPQQKSNMMCDGGGWLRSNKQRTSFLVIVQDEIVKSAKTMKTTTKTIQEEKASSLSSRRKALKELNNGNNHGSHQNQNKLSAVVSSSSSSTTSTAIVALPNTIRKVSRMGSHIVEC
jgi:hypothetical protein